MNFGIRYKDDIDAAKQILSAGTNGVLYSDMKILDMYFWFLGSPNK